MDPYLEGEMWQEFHDTLANEIRSQIIPQLGSRYAALLAKRYVLDRPALGVFDVPSSRTIYPDVHIVGPSICCRPKRTSWRSTCCARDREFR
jgi:hypothetical protein